MKKTSIHQTREQWLEAAVELITGLFVARKYTVPDCRVSCGWPSRGALSAKKRSLGECWDKVSSSDAIAQVFISPWLGDGDGDLAVTGGQGVLATLVHELVHVTVGNKEKHNKVFKKCALAVGLEGKMTSTYAGAELLEYLKTWAEKLGPYPHGNLDKLKSNSKPDKNRQMKCECPTCGYTVRLTRKWMNEVGLPHCPKHGAMVPEIPIDAGGGDEGDDDGGEE